MASSCCEDDDTCAAASALPLLPLPAPSGAQADDLVHAALLPGARLLCEGVAGVRGAIPRELALAAAAEVDEALRQARAAAAAHVGRDDSRCLCSVRALEARWDSRLRASGFSGAGRARLVTQQAMAESVPGPDDERFVGPVRELSLRGSCVRGQLDRRYDLRLHFVGAVKAAVLAAVRALRPAIAEVLTDDALVCELACLVTDPGATRQRLHADTTADDRGGFRLTAFIALQDVKGDMGGTLVVPGTANRAGHESMATIVADGSGRRERRLLCERGRRFEGDAGSCLLMDSRCLHCGGANTSGGGRRRMLYVTFQVPHSQPAGGTMSILPEYEGRFRLRNVDRWVAPASD